MEGRVPRDFGHRLGLRRAGVAIAAALFLITSALPLVASADSTRTGLELRQPHTFSTDEAKIRIDQLLDYWESRFGVQRRWEGDDVRVRGRFWGIHFDGVVRVREGEVEAIARDPGGPIRRRTAIDYVAGKLRKYLHPTYEEG